MAQVETDKATMDLEVYDDGVLLKRVIGEGDAVPIGGLIAILGQAGRRHFGLSWPSMAQVVMVRQLLRPAAEAAAPATGSGPRSGSLRPPVAAPVPAPVAAPAPAATAPSADGRRVKASPAGSQVGHRAR